MTNFGAALLLQPHSQSLCFNKKSRPWKPERNKPIATREFTGEETRLPSGGRAEHMLAINDGNITLSRGDTATIALELESDAPLEGAEAIVTLKRNPGDANALWVKRYLIENDTVLVALGTEDTSFPVGRYWWDVRLLFPNGDIITPVQPKEFMIAAVVGDVR